MGFYTVDVRDRVIQRVTQGYNGVGNKRFFLIEARSAKQARAKADSAAEPVGSGICSSCHHRHCRVCQECSVAKQYSDYWICHCCGALTERVPSSHLREVSNGLGEN